jgi:hypothetical protein
MHIVGDTMIIWGGCYLDIKCFDELYLYDVRYGVILIYSKSQNLEISKNIR